MSKKKIKKDPLLDDESQKVSGSVKSKAKRIGKTKVEVKEKEVEKKPEATSPAPAQANITKILHGEVAITKANLEKEPKVNFIIPLTDGEKPGAFDTVQINGYRLTIKKGVLVPLPQSVAQLLANKYRISMEAGRENRIDRASDVEEALN